MTRERANEAASDAPLDRLTGRCNCGAVSFVAAGPFRAAEACHCTTCRRQSGHFVAATQIDRSGLTVAGGESLTWYCASDRARRGFCRVCGAPLFWEPADLLHLLDRRVACVCGAPLFWEPAGSDRVSIFMGCLDVPTGIRLAEHIFVGEKGDYYEITDGLPQALERDTMAR